MSDLLWAPVKEGAVEQYTSEVAQKKDTRGSSELGKDAFLQLLVAQMKYQDPLNPSSDTEFISQLAQFSALEQMQNLNTTMANSQAFGYVGKYVVIDSSDSSGNAVSAEGIVDYVKVSNGNVYVGIGEKTYLASDVVSIIDTDYLAQLKAPKVTEGTATFDLDNPEDITINVSMGTDDGKATAMGVYINGKAIISDYLTYDEEKGTVTIDKNALMGLEPGIEYDVGFVFDDKLQTTVTDTYSIKVIGNKKTVDSSENIENTESSEEQENTEVENSSEEIEQTELA